MGSCLTKSTKILLVSAFIGTLLCGATLVVPSVLARTGVSIPHHPPSEADRKLFLGYKVEAEKGDAEAQYNVGVCYYAGQGVARDTAEGTKWLCRAAEQNFVKAQLELGFNYGLGSGVVKDGVESIKWYRRAAEQNDAGAQGAVGQYYSDGRLTIQNNTEAYAWCTLAARTDEFARELLKKLKRSMSPLQIADGKMRAKELRAQIVAKTKGGGK